MRKLVLLISVLVFGATVSFAQDVAEPVTQLAAPPDPAAYTWEQVIGNLVNPLYLTGAEDSSGRMFVLEQAGRVWVLENGSRLSTPFLDISSISSQDILNSYSERGLLGLAFHPDYTENGEFFVHYNNYNGDTVIARYRVSDADPNLADPNSAEIILTYAQPYSNHNGGQIKFGPDGYLYIAMGDGGSQGDPQNYAQNPESLLGKILRIDVDNTGDAAYGIPEDNPAFTVNTALAPEVWSLGLRNPWRFSFDRVTGDMYIADVGQNQLEEINFQPVDSPGGENYGWRPYEGSRVYNPNDPVPADMVLPIAEYDHSNGCSVTGGYVYRGEALPELHGVYFFGDWCSGRIWATYRDTADEWQTMIFAQNSGYTISSFGEDDAGELYLLDYYGGRLLKLVAN